MESQNNSIQQKKRVGNPLRYVCPTCGGFKGYDANHCRTCFNKKRTLPRTDGICKGCGVYFIASRTRPQEYCSKVCFAKTGLDVARRSFREKVDAGILPPPQGFRKKKKFRKCAWCDCVLHKKVRFCSDECRSHGKMAQLRQVTDGFIKAKSIRVQREIVREMFNNTCCRCGYNAVPEILQVHHKSGNPRSRSISDLELLCPNCHEAYHFLTKTGRFDKRSRRKGGRQKHGMTYRQTRRLGANRLPEDMK